MVPNEDAIYAKIAEMIQEGLCATRLDIITLSGMKKDGSDMEKETVALFIVRKKWIDLVQECLSSNATNTSLEERIRRN